MLLACTAKGSSDVLRALDVSEKRWRRKVRGRTLYVVSSALREGAVIFFNSSLSRRSFSILVRTSTCSAPSASPTPSHARPTAPWSAAEGATVDAMNWL